MSTSQSSPYTRASLCDINLQQLLIAQHLPHGVMGGAAAAAGTTTVIAATKALTTTAAASTCLQGMAAAYRTGRHTVAGRSSKSSCNSSSSQTTARDSTNSNPNMGPNTVMKKCVCLKATYCPGFPPHMGVGTFSSKLSTYVCHGGVE